MVEFAIWHMEGVGNQIPLSEVVFLPKREQSKFFHGNVRIILRIWSKYRTELTSDFSPLLSFLAHPSFQQVQLLSNFNVWQMLGIQRFCDLGDAKGMFPLTQLCKKPQTNNTQINQFQYL